MKGVTISGIAGVLEVSREQRMHLIAIEPVCCSAVPIYNLVEGSRSVQPLHMFGRHLPDLPRDPSASRGALQQVKSRGATPALIIPPNNGHVLSVLQCLQSANPFRFLSCA